MAKQGEPSRTRAKVEQHLDLVNQEHTSIAYSLYPEPTENPIGVWYCEATPKDLVVLCRAGFRLVRNDLARGFVQRIGRQISGYPRRNPGPKNAESPAASFLAGFHVSVRVTHHP